jgi:molybdenum cofactor cytidylyltransferase
MIFGRVRLSQARGGILAHSLKTADRVLRKGALIDETAYALLEQAGHREVTIARLDPGDMPEGEAASHLAALLLTAGFRRSSDIHGRVNLFAETSGLLRLDVEKINRLNMVDEAVTLATLADRAVVAKDDMVATIKIIPFAVSANTIAVMEALIRQGDPAFALKPFRPLRVGLILTTLPQLKDAAITHTITATEARIAAHGGTLLAPIIIDHAREPLAAAIRDLLTKNAELILISGASAVTDRLDVAPKAIVAAGGVIKHFGMPVDPGNLICFGDIDQRPVIILPGCARSPKLNGIDWVLDRIFAGESVGPEEVAAMGVGGLLKEADMRPAPRLTEVMAGYGKSPKMRPKVAALVLAAGHSKRMAPNNKLLAVMPDGRTMIAATVANVLASVARPVIVVTGHQDAAIRETLRGAGVRFVHAHDHAEGIAASLRAGIGALSSSIGAALICLGDMPLVSAGVMNQLIDAYDPSEGREIVLPVVDGQRGNPVLWSSRYFPDLLKLSGDTGARQILHNYMESVAEVPVEDESVLRDFDTPDALAALAKWPTNLAAVSTSPSATASPSAADANGNAVSPAARGT